jgi:transposase
MECVIETKAITILQFLRGLRGDLHVTFEEGTSAAWLYDLIQPHVTEVVVCDPRQNALLNHGNKSDRIDARKLADLLRSNQLKPVYHGEHGVRALKELVRSYLTISKDVARVMTRVKALYRSWAIPCTGKQVYSPHHRTEWLAKINEPGVYRRAEFYYQQLDALRSSRQQVRRELLAESQKHPAWKLLCQILSIGPIRAAVLIGILQTPHRFRTKSGNCGLSAVLALRRTAAATIAMSKEGAGLVGRDDRRSLEEILQIEIMAGVEPANGHLLGSTS